jgi:CRP-like cAMP-binding protein
MRRISARVFRHLGQFAPLTDVESRALEEALVPTVRRFQARDGLAKQGERMPGVFVILDGFACRYKVLPDGRRQMLALLLPGQVSDPRSVLLPRMDHSIAALGPVEAAFLAKDVVQRLERLPVLWNAMALSALVQQSIAHEWLVNVGHRSSFERISHLFCEIHTQMEAVGLVQDGSCEMPLTQADIADALAITPVHVNRTLMELRRTGLVSFQSRRLTIHDVAALHRVAGFDACYLLPFGADPATGSCTTAAAAENLLKALSTHVARGHLLSGE